ncbi:LuxR C-terminal-related transcriptional regulator [Saccharibacillus sacchari]|uniref:LuxR C-terminal-related transcriptional regulator n=1 Tax=Saccharibacillus sacchari TaxID=456493 RepID=A0ACC6P7E4_9BACL
MRKKSADGESGKMDFKPENAGFRPETNAFPQVERPRLIERLVMLSEEQIVYLTAPAGYGKTTLMKQWARRNGGEAAYLEVQLGDDSLHGFWERTVQVLNDVAEKNFAEQAKDALDYLRVGQNQNGITLLLHHLASIAGSPTLIWDNLHLLHNAELLESLAFFAEHKPAGLRVAAAGRGYPPFPAARLIARQRIALLGPEELRFTEAEGEAFYCGGLGRDASGSTNEVAAPPGKASRATSAEAVARTRSDEGWIAAMQRSEAELDRYIDEQVWSGLDENTRRFLLDASVLRLMNGRICRALRETGNRPMPEELFRRTELLIVPYGPEEGWFRLHGRFAGFLRRKLDNQSPENSRALLRRAAEAFWREGRRADALEHTLDGGHYEQAGRMLQEVGTDSDRHDSVSAAWLSKRLAELDGGELLSEPFLYFSLTYSVLLGDRNYERARRLLDEARRMDDERRQNEAGQNGLPREDITETLNALNAVYAAVANRDFAQALGLMRLAAQEPDARPNKHAFARLALPPVYSILAEYGQQTTTGTAAIGKTATLSFLNEACAWTGSHDMAAAFAAARAEALHEYDEAAEAARIAEQAYAWAAAGRRSVAAFAPAAGLALARAYLALGERGQAKYALLRLRKDLPRLRMQEAEAACAAELALLALDEEEPGPAREWVRRFAGKTPKSGELLAESTDLRRRFDLLRIRVALGDDAEARPLADLLRDEAAKRGNAYLSARIGVLDTLLLEREDRREEAYDRLGGVLFDAEPHGFVRVFVDEGEPVRKLLSGLLASRKEHREDKRPSLAYARLLLARFGGEAGVSEALALILTRQEIEVLSLIGENRTNKEIAAQLGIRYETVRTHIRNVYAKLKVGSREDALAEGRRLGL